MTDEEMAKEYVDENGFGSDCNNLTSFDANMEIEKAFLAGLKAGRLKWHKVADGDLPKVGVQVLSEQGTLVVYKGDGFNWVEYSPNADNLKLRKWEEPIAWCEIPKYTEK